MSDLSKEAKLILKAAVSDPHGTVMRLLSLQGATTIKTPPAELMISGKGGDIAVWDSALDELATQGLLNKVKDVPLTQIFQVTKKGYECAESLGF